MWGGLCCGVQEHLPAKTQWVFCCIACPVGNGLVPAEITSVPLLQPQRIKAKSLTFAISGEGHLPWVRVLCPGLRNGRGDPVLCFKRHLLGDSEKLPLILCNDGIVPVQVRTCSGSALVWEPVLVPWRKGAPKYERPGNRSQKFFLGKQLTSALQEGSSSWKCDFLTSLSSSAEHNTGKVVGDFLPCLSIHILFSWACVMSQFH